MIKVEKTIYHSPTTKEPLGLEQETKWVMKAEKLWGMIAFVVALVSGLISTA